MIEARVPLPVEMPVIGGRHRQELGYRVRRPRGAGSWLAVLTLDGCGLLEWAGGSTEARSGHLFLWPPESPQDYRASAEGWDLAWIHFRADGRRAGALGSLAETDPPLLIRPADSDLQADLLRLSEAGVPGGPLEALLLEARLEALLLQIRIARRRSEGLAGRVERAKAFARRRLPEGCSVGEMAGAVGLSESRFAQIFCKETGEPPARWLEGERLDLARIHLLASGCTVAEAAERAGYLSPFHFTRS
ncbi:MAG: AraC family transcriptional regulator, partial [Fimbriimonadaceae bacterium]|nr:AraC family transcriptional regulator [Fimbriimonadaceae bacterium]